MGSESAKQLADALGGVTRVYSDGSYSPKYNHILINWGNSHAPAFLNRPPVGFKVLNAPASVALASNKLRTFTTLNAAGVSVPEFTTLQNVAQGWLDMGLTVIERHSLTGNSGAGIRVVNSTDENVSDTLTAAPLYTKFIPKKKEFRVHVFGGEVIDYSQKKKRSTETRPVNFNKYVSSSEMGWVFCKNNIEHIQAVKDAAIAAVRALGLDFGAVDIMYHADVSYVLEVNTAPGMMPSTLEAYVTKFNSLLGTNVGGTAVLARDIIGEDQVTLRLSRADARRLHTILSAVI